MRTGGAAGFSAREAIDDERERQPVAVARLARVEAEEPVAVEPIEQPVDAIARDGAVVVDAVRQVHVHRLDGADGVALQLDGPAERLVLRHALIHLRPPPSV